MHKFWICSRVGVSSILISLTSSWKKVSGRCYLKVSWGISIWMGSIEIGSTGTLGTCSINPRLVDEDGLICCFDWTGWRTSMVPVENNFGYVANIKSSTSLEIPKWKS